MKKQEVVFVVDDEYREWIALIKDRIKSSQIKASIKVNRELMELYWHIGEDIVNRQKHSKWGDGLLRQMSIDLKKAFPDMSGFSESNLKIMRLWYRFYAEAVNGLQVVNELSPDECT